MARIGPPRNGGYRVWAGVTSVLGRSAAGRSEDVHAPLFPADESARLDALARLDAPGTGPL